ncbi:MAG: VOC family protein, partial [Acidimicrobiales bacterium]
MSEHDVQAIRGPANGAERFELGGVNHLALVCRDMARTVDFYTSVLDMPLVKTIELPAGMGQHFFFDCGAGDCLAFFWFPEAPEPV